MDIGYARVSTGGQELEDQREQLAAAGCQRIFLETVSGAAPMGQRPELTRLLDHLRPGDVVTVTRLDRLARSTRELLQIVERLQASEAGFRSLGEPWADTTSPAGRMVMTVFSGVAEFERSLIVERTQRGRRAAKARGVQFGRRRKLSDDQVEHAKRLVFEEQKPVSEVARLFSVHRSTLYRLINEHSKA